MGKLKKIAWPIENGEFIYVPKRVIDSINKTAVITKQYTVKGSGENTQSIFITKAPRVETEYVKNDQRGRLVIEYENKKGRGHGLIELYDMGPDLSKKNIKEEN